MRSRTILLAFALVLSGAVGTAKAGVYLSRSEAIEQAFPDADRVTDRTFVLDDTQSSAVEKLARAKLDSKLVTVYTGYKANEVLGHALIDIHTVRTLPEAFMVVITPTGEIRSLRMLAFYEPGEYEPPTRWLGQFHNEALSEELQLRGKIHGIAGSTLSARAVTSGVRRALALYDVLMKPPPGDVAP